ncbi:hypothetical protein MICAD_1160015 [Microcystis aeruginosa PCC 7941]|nr:hypothetical protein MICAD_1160015 [Microcystis aeruginosa PCC 7941]
MLFLTSLCLLVYNLGQGELRNIAVPVHKRYILNAEKLN